MDPHGALPLQEAEDERHTVLRGDTQAQMDVVG
jgi:hypothetical protein